MQKAQSKFQKTEKKNKIKIISEMLEFQFNITQASKQASKQQN